MSEIKECLTCFDELQKQKKIYQPGKFWREASTEILGSLRDNGLNEFRRLPLPLMFFVPTYGYPGNGISLEDVLELKKWLQIKEFSRKQEMYVEQHLDGRTSALADYRTFLASEYSSQRIPNLINFSESQVGEPIEQFEFDGKRYSRSALNYLLGLSFLKKYLNLADTGVIMEIGGGFGTLGEIIHKCVPKTKYIDIDIPPTSCCASYYLKEIFGIENVTDVTGLNLNSNIDVADLKSMTILPTWQIENITGKIDLFINFISFQEMEPHIVRNYLNHVTRLNAEWILLRNMREGKQLSSTHKYGVDKPIFSDNYSAMLPDYNLIETNVIPFGFKTVDGFHSELMLFRKKEV